MKIRVYQPEFPTPAVLTLLMLAGAFARVYGLGAWGYQHDETWHIYVAGQPTLADIFYTDLKIDGHPVLPYILWHYLLMLGNDPWIMRLPSLMAGILCIPAGYLLGQEMFESRSGALFCAFFMAFSGAMIEQSDVVRGYDLMMLFTLLGMWAAFRYRHRPQPKYLLFYAVSMALAFLCEYAVAPVVVFTALHLLKSIYQKPGAKLPAFVGWVAIHIGFLVYLLWMVYMLRHVGDVHFGGFIFYSYTKTPLIMAERYIPYFMGIIYDNSFISLISTGSNNIDIVVLSFLVFFCIALAGFVWLCRHRKWDVLLLVGILVAVTLGFFYFKITPMQLYRRNMALTIGVMALFYGGFSYIVQEGWKNRSLSFSPETWALIATACLCAVYAVYGNSWRILRPSEFQQTRADGEDFFAFLHAHAGQNDIIVTDASTYFHFWNREHSHCSNYARPLSDSVAYYPCYRIPIYVIRNDMRMNRPFIFNLADFQRALRDINQLHRLENVKNVWIVGLQYVAAKTTLLNPHFSYELLHLLSPAKEKRYHKKIDRLIKEQFSFARYAYARASPKKIVYIYPCLTSNDHVSFSDDDDCIMKMVMLALPKSELESRIINHALFYDPEVFLEEIRQQQYN